MIITFEYEGHTFEANKKSLTDYRTMKALTRSKDNPAAYFAALEDVFEGRDEEYAELLGGSTEKMGGLFVAAIQAAGSEAKNS